MLVFLLMLVPGDPALFGKIAERYSLTPANPASYSCRKSATFNFRPDESGEEFFYASKDSVLHRAVSADNDKIECVNKTQSFRLERSHNEWIIKKIGRPEFTGGMQYTGKMFHAIPWIASRINLAMLDSDVYSNVKTQSWKVFGRSIAVVECNKEGDSIRLTAILDSQLRIESYTVVSLIKGVQLTESGNKSYFPDGLIREVKTSSGQDRTARTIYLYNKLPDPDESVFMLSAYGIPDFQASNNWHVSAAASLLLFGAAMLIHRRR